MFGERDSDPGLADVLEPAADFAFAPTVHVRDLGDDDPTNPPASNPVLVHTPAQGTQCITPFAYPLPDASVAVSTSTKLRVLHARLRHGLRGAREEIAELWAETRSVEGGWIARLSALWSFWQWDRSDVVNAGVITLVVFTFVAIVGGLTVVSASDDSGAAQAGLSAAEVRAPRTVDQHTGRVFLAIAKAQKR